MRNVRKLEVWRRGHRLTLAVYKTTATFPREELYGLTGQMRRASAAIPANVAEGCGRGSNADLARFLQIAFGSASELENHLLLARDLSLLRTCTRRSVRLYHDSSGLLLGGERCCLRPSSSASGRRSCSCG